MATKKLEPTRRDFMTVAAGAFAAVGGAAALWPFIDQMNPDASTLSLSSTEVDLSPIEEG
ncbi:MAG: twin-arginine translocation signal domain-containing protein, partial [Alphaproteobacteria bacterium]